MEKSDKPLTRDALVSMQVIDARGHIIGKVKDVSFEVGRAGISLSVETNDGRLQTISWDDVQGASDFIVLKPPQTQTTAQNVFQALTQASPTLCPTCGQPLTWIDQYKRWYCYNEKKYV